MRATHASFRSFAFSHWNGTFPDPTEAKQDTAHSPNHEQTRTPRRSTNTHKTTQGVRAALSAFAGCSTHKKKHYIRQDKPETNVVFHGLCPSQSRVLCTEN